MWWCVDVCVPVETLHECDGCNIGKEGGRIGDSNPMRSGSAGHAIFQTSDCSNWWTNQSTLFSEFTGSFIPGGLGSIKTLQKCSVYIANGVQPRLRLKKKKKVFTHVSARRALDVCDWMSWASLSVQPPWPPCTEWQDCLHNYGDSWSPPHHLLTTPQGVYPVPVRKHRFR